MVSVGKESSDCWTAAEILEDVHSLESKGKLKDVKFIHRQRIKYRKKG